tara:strand:- start:1116 stop:1316 length:201 start_codon:yes stop_codon:yes gene_type:complete
MSYLYQKTLAKEWKEANGDIDDFLTKIEASPDTIIVVLEERNGIDMIDVHNDSNGYVFVNLYEGDE